ncbi:SRPBCC family protein [Euzebya tangerina]|uniref:SRPBCC family protein n=1 Tax=Euzebya tangerina TaxID=591198 RepID=UPI0013C31C53|nr:SRPBCC domain-containing protein [Euzebya tangerina]
MSGEHRLVFDEAVAADLDDVWRLISTADGRAAWFGTRAQIDLRVGGASHVDWGADEAIEGTVRAVEEGRRLRIAYEADGVELGAEEYLLSQRGGVTHVRLIQTFTPGVDDAAAEGLDTWDGWLGDLERGWRLFLRSLAFAAAEAARPSRLVTGRYVPLGDRTPQAGFAVALEAVGLSPDLVTGDTATLPGIEQPATALLVEAPHTVLVATADHTLVLDLEGPPGRMVCYAQAAVHGPADRRGWRQVVLGRVSVALGA